ncbi:DNA-binding protein [Paraburkholderia tropica]
MLTRLVAALEKPKRLDETLWSTEQIAQWLGLSKQSVELRVVTRPDFPGAFRPVNSAQAQRRWFASDVLDWARKNKGGLPLPRPGRRRKPV